MVEPLLPITHRKITLSLRGKTNSRFLSKRKAIMGFWAAKKPTSPFTTRFTTTAVITMLLLLSPSSVLTFTARSLQRGTRPFILSRLFSKKVIFLGTPEVAASSLQKIIQEADGYQVVSVVTQPPKPRKRKKAPEPSPVAKMAEKYQIPVLNPEKAKDPLFLEELEKMQPDLCITAAYGQYLPKRFLAIPKYGTVNIHPSLLPKWRGASPVQRSLQNGDNPVGVTLLYTVSKMDAGPIVAQKSVPIDINDTSTTVLPMLFEHGTDLLLENMPKILSGEITIETATPQKEEDATAASMIDSSEGELKVWEESATTCHNKLRGFSMWPGAFLYIQIGDREPIKVKVIETRLVDGETREPTDVIELGPKKGDGLYLVCFDGSILELVTVQPATRKAFPARDFQNGYPGETIRWVKTPDDQAQSPEKYNSRKQVAAADLDKKETEIIKSEVRKNPTTLSLATAWERVEQGGSLVPVNKETIEFTSGLLGGSAGLFLGGTFGGLVCSILANYAARKRDDGLTEVVRGASTACIEVLNYLVALEVKYQALKKTRDALYAKIDELKSSESDNGSVIVQAETTLSNLQLKFRNINDEYDVVGAFLSTINAFGDIFENTANSLLQWNEESQVTEKLIVQLKGDSVVAVDKTNASEEVLKQKS